MRSMSYYLILVFSALSIPSQAYSFAIATAKPGEWVAMKANKGLYASALTAVQTDEGTYFIFINNKVGSGSVWLSVLSPLSANYDEANAITYVSGGSIYKTSKLASLQLSEGTPAAGTTKSVASIAIWTPSSNNSCSSEMKSFVKGSSHQAILAINSRSLHLTVATKNLAVVLKKVLSADCRNW